MANYSLTLTTADQTGQSEIIIYLANTAEIANKINELIKHPFFVELQVKKLGVTDNLEQNGR